MAKRGYRGKNAHSDAKVSKNPSSGKYSAKLTAEYEKLNPKLKYDYIRTHYYYPQAELTISGTANFAANNSITMSSLDNSVTLAISGSTGTSTLCFKADGTDAQATDGLVSVINAQAPGKLFAFNHTNSDSQANILKVRQLEPGPDGNTTVTFSTINSGVALNGTSIINSSSAFTFTGG
jgi:hypothetical protein